MKKMFLLILVGFSFLCLFTVKASAHCEIPCGIYNDEMRINMINEHITTIEKSMNQIMQLEKKEHHNPNQLLRWIMNKEEHANEIQHIVSQYFMTQRIKLDTKNYETKIGLLHQILIYSMKCKQTTDVTNVNKLKDIVKDFQALYFKTE
ncbi:MAG: superoxide dismutase [Ni] [Desulfobacterales bacterium]